MPKRRNNPVVYDARRRAHNLHPDNEITTDGSEYTPEEVRYLQACERYRASSGKRYLTALDYLRVAKEHTACH